MRTSNTYTDEILLECLLTLQPRPRVQNFYNECLMYALSCTLVQDTL